MSILLGQLGTYAFTLTVSAGEALSAVKLALSSYLELTDWEVWDSEYAVYRSLNVDGSYKYLRLVIDNTTAIAYTEVYASWDMVTHTGTNVARQSLTATPASDTLKTGFYLTHATQQVVIHVYVHQKWLLISSVLGTANKFGLTNTWSGSVTSPNNFQANASLTFTGIGGCLELDVPSNDNNLPCTPFIWFHTAWSVFDMYMEDQSDTGNDYYAYVAYARSLYQSIFGARTSRAFAVIPKNTQGNVGNLSVSSMLFRNLGQLRTNIVGDPLNVAWSTKQPMSELYVRDMVNSAPLGSIFGLKAMRAGANTFGQQVSATTDPEFRLGVGDSHTFALLHTEVSTTMNWTEWAYYYGYYTWLGRGSYTTTFTPKFFIPIN